MSLPMSIFKEKFRVLGKEAFEWLRLKEKGISDEQFFCVRFCASMVHSSRHC